MYLIGLFVVTFIHRKLWPVILHNFIYVCMYIIGACFTVISCFIKRELSYDQSYFNDWDKWNTAVKFSGDSEEWWVECTGSGWDSGCHNLIISVGGWAGRAAGGRRRCRGSAPAPVPLARRPRALRPSGTQRASATRRRQTTRGKTKGMLGETLWGAGAVARALITHFNYDTDRIN